MAYDAAEEIAAVRQECERAVETILDAVGRITEQAGRLSADAPAAAQELQDAAVTIMEACTFQDYVGQRLTRIVAGGPADPLLAGPASEGGISQAEVEALLNAPF